MTDVDLVGEAILRFVYDGADVLLDFLDADGDGGDAVVDKRYLHAAVDQIMAEEDVGELLMNAPERVLWHVE